MSWEGAVKRSREYALRAYESGRAPPSHGLDHVVRVVGLCRWLARELGMGAEEAGLLEAAAWLHDVSIALTGSKSGHAAKSAEEAARVLKDCLAPTQLEVVVTAIREHSWSGGRRPSTLLSAALQDADRLDALGAVGIYRVFAYGVWAGRVFYCIEDPFAEKRELNDGVYTLDHFYCKLLKLPSSMNTEPARREAERRVKAMEAFLEELRRELLGELQ